MVYKCELFERNKISANGCSLGGIVLARTKALKVLYAGLSHPVCDSTRGLLVGFVSRRKFIIGRVGGQHGHNINYSGVGRAIVVVVAVRLLRVGKTSCLPEVYFPAVTYILPD